MSKSLAIVSVPLAPYRVDFYDRMAGALGTGWSTHLIYGQATPPDHAWSDLLDGITFLTPWLEPGCRLGGHFRPDREPRWPSLALLRRLSAVNPSVILIAEYSAYCVAALLYGRMRGIPVIVQTELGAFCDRGQIPGNVRFMHWFFGCMVSGQLASAPAANVPFNSAIHRICQTPHAVSHAEYGPEPVESPERPVVLVVGSLIPRKGLDLLALACGRLVKKGIDFEVRLIGGGDVEWCARHFRDAGMADRVSLLGFFEGKELRDQYRRASIFVLASRFDTYGVVTHEAAVSGLPLIVSAHAGSSAVLVDEGVNGFVVYPERTDELAGRLELLLTDADLRKRMGTESRRIGIKWSVEETSASAARFIADFC